MCDYVKMNTITSSNHNDFYLELKAFYRNEILKQATDIGSRELCRKLNISESHISAVLRRDSFSALKRLYEEITAASYTPDTNDTNDLKLN